MPLDYSHILGPSPQAGAVRGQKFFGDALDAVLQRRQEMERQRLQMEAQAHENQLQRDLTGGYYRQMGEQAGRTRDEVERTNREHERIAAVHQQGERAVQESTARRTAGEGVYKGYLPPATARRIVGSFGDSAPAGAPSTAGPGSMATPPGPPPQPPSDAPLPPTGMIADPAAASAQMARPQPTQPPPPDEWDALTPRSRAEAFAAKAQGMNLPPRLAALTPEIEAGTSLGLIEPEKSLDRYEHERDRMSHELSASMAGDRRNTPSADAQARLEATRVSNFGTEKMRWEQQADVDKFTEVFNVFESAKGAIGAAGESGDTIAMSEALFKVARYITGVGVLTKEEYNKTVQNTKGLVEGFLSKVEKGLTGEISDAEREAAQLYIDNATKLIRQKAILRVQNYDKRFSPGSYYGRHTPEEVQAGRDALIDRFRLTPDDVMPSDKRADAIVKRLRLR